MFYILESNELKEIDLNNIDFNLTTIKLNPLYFELESNIL